MPPTIGLRLLGPPEVECDGQPIRSFASRKALALLSYVVLAEQPVRRGALATLLWADKPEAQGRANLSWSLHAIAQALPGTLITAHDTVRWAAPPGHTLDCTRFLTLAAHGDGTNLAAAATIYRGPLLHGLDLTDCPEWELWLTEQREQWQRRLIQLLAALTQQHIQRHSYAAGLETVGRWLQLEPLDELAHRQRMWLLHASGQRGAALVHYETCRRLLLEEVGDEPSAETAALYHQLQRAPAALPGTVPLLPLVGRLAERSRVISLICRPDVKLVCISGPAGVGKTALAQHAVAELNTQFQDGIGWIGIAGVTTEPQLVAALGAALELPLGDRPWPRLRTYLSAHEMLLVLDGWQLPATVSPQLAALIQAAPRVKLLVTGREHLAFPQTQHVVLAGLACRMAGDRLQAPAVQLFRERMRRIERGWEMTTDNAAAVLQICELVQGLPLGIELACRWGRTLSVADLATALAADPTLLAHGFRDLPAPQLP